MSFLAEFNKLHFSVKSIALTISSTVPFFFIMVYLFHPKSIVKIGGNPFVDIDFYFVIIVCFCLSVLWFILNFIFSVMAVYLIDKKKTEEGEELAGDDFMHVTFLSTYFYSITYISIIIFLNYVWFDLSFLATTIIGFCFIVARIARVGFVLLLDVSTKKDQDKLAKEAEHSLDHQG